VQQINIMLLMMMHFCHSMFCHTILVVIFHYTLLPVCDIDKSIVICQEKLGGELESGWSHRTVCLLATAVFFPELIHWFLKHDQ